jgi:hypothetical protein
MRPTQARTASQLRELQEQQAEPVAAQAEALHVAGDAWRTAQAAQADSLQSMQTSLFKCAAQ